VTPVKQRRQRRPRTKGVAALEFALSLTFLAPLIGAALDFGYYFYVGSSAEEAARAGVRQAVTKFFADNGPAAICTAGAGVGEAVLVATYVSGTNGEPYNVMNQAPLGMGANTTTTVSCDGAPVDPSWHVQVQVDFRPAMGIVANFMRAGNPIAGKPTVRYLSATLTSN
jgi:Flp pilus assembly protein TadG